MTDTSPSMASADPALLDTEAMDVVADAPPTPTPPTKPSGPHPRSSPRPKHPPIPAEISSRKTIYLIRHGVSRHNHHNISLTSPSLTDASLDTVGLHQATAMGARYRYAVGEMYANGDKDMKPLDLVVTSPLTRCLETAHHAFSMGCPLPPAPLQEDEYRSLMKQAKSEGKSKVRMPNPQNHPTGPPEFICLESLREAHGIFYPDKRRSRTMLEAGFPMCDFSDMVDDDDTLWRSDKRESLSEVNRRITHFFEWLSTRSETNIAVVTHGVWMEECLRRYCPGVLKGGRRVLNGEVYKCQCAVQIRETSDGENVVGPLVIKKGEVANFLSHAGDNERGVRLSALQRDS